MMLTRWRDADGLNGEQNKHMQVHEVSDSLPASVTGALNENYAISRGNQCQRFMFSLSLNPQQNEPATVAVFDKSIEKIEK